MAFEHIKEPTGRVMNNVINLKERTGLLRALKGSLEVVPPRDMEAENREVEAKRGRHLIAKGLNLIRDNESPQAAIEYLRGTLAAIDGSMT